MSRLFVSWVVNPFGEPLEFGNSVLDFSEPENRLSIQKIELKLQNELAKQRNNKILFPVILFFTPLRE